MGIIIALNQLTRNMKKKPLPVSNEELLREIQVHARAMELFQKEINENINQILYVVRLKLATIDLHQDDQTREHLEQSGILIGQAISDLRKLAKQLQTISGGSSQPG
jgi:hypothetical protein